MEANKVSTINWAQVRYNQEQARLGLIKDIQQHINEFQKELVFSMDLPIFKRRNGGAFEIICAEFTAADAHLTQEKFVQFHDEIFGHSIKPIPKEVEEEAKENFGRLVDFTCSRKYNKNEYKFTMEGHKRREAQVRWCIAKIRKLHEIERKIDSGKPQPL